MRGFAVSPRGWTAIAAVALLLGACTEIHLSRKRTASLAAGTTPDVLTAGGALSEPRAEAVIEAKVDASPSGRGGEDLVKAVEVATGAPFVLGNNVRLLVDGPRTYDAVFAALEEARHSIHIETYWFADDVMGQRFARVLEEKAAEGVDVRIIYDALGSFWTSPQFFDELSRHGIEVATFHPLNPSKIWKINNRDHRKLIVVDGLVGFTGGINICDPYAEASTSKPGPSMGISNAWRDTHAELRGPAVALLQTKFIQTWKMLGMPITLPDEGVFPRLASSGGDLVQVVSSDGGDEREFRIYNAYLEAIKHAEQRIWISQAYFAPDRRFRKALTKAAKRGVDVRVILPAFNNSTLVYQASRATYDEMLEGGVELYELTDAFLHAKTAVIDGVWSTVGSSNLDRRSFIHNNELNVVVVGADFAREMEDLFRIDLEGSEQLDLETWRQRPIFDRVKEFLSRPLAYWL